MKTLGFELCHLYCRSMSLLVNQDSSQTTYGWIHVVVSTYLREGIVFSLLKKVIFPILKKLLLDPTELDNFHPVSKFLLCGKVTAKLVKLQLQRIPGGNRLLGSLFIMYQTRLRKSQLHLSMIFYGMRIFVIYLPWIYFDMINHCIILNQNRGLGMEGRHGCKFPYPYLTST